MRLSANKIKQLRGLSQKKFRAESSLFIVEGEKLVNEALHSDFEVLEVYREEEIGADSMRKISMLTTPSPILAVVRQKHAAVESIEFKQNRIYFLLDGIKDPGNFGTILRTAEWFGISGIIASPDCVELYNPKTVQATMGAIFRMNVLYTPLPEIIARFKENGCEVFATVLDGKPIDNLAQRVKGKCSAFLFGNESEGISDEVKKLIKNENKLLIPQYGKDGKAIVAKEFCSSESLNVASSAAVICALIR